jgi:hypothetical protein
VDSTPPQLRRQAEHCRDLAHSLVDERVRLILTAMANEYDEEARTLDAIQTADRSGTGD